MGGMPALERLYVDSELARAISTGEVLALATTPGFLPACTGGMSEFGSVEKSRAALISSAK